MDTKDRARFYNPEQISQGPGHHAQAKAEATPTSTKAGGGGESQGLGVRVGGARRRMGGTVRKMIFKLEPEGGMEALWAKRRDV